MTYSARVAISAGSSSSKNAPRVDGGMSASVRVRKSSETMVEL